MDDRTGMSRRRVGIDAWLPAAILRSGIPPSTSGGAVGRSPRWRPHPAEEAHEATGDCRRPARPPRDERADGAARESGGTWRRAADTAWRRSGHLDAETDQQ